MYTVWIDDLCIYSPVITDLDYKIINPVLTEELNKTGTFEFTLPKENRGYDQIQKMNSLVTIKEDGVDIWWGRVTDDEKDYKNNRKIHCEGILGYLLDSIVRPYDHQDDLPVLFRKFIDDHNARVGPRKKQFVIRYCDVTDPNNYVHYSSTQYPATLDEINEKLIKTHGGYLKAIRENGVNYLDYTVNPWSFDINMICPQTIEFGKNLIDFKKVVDATGVITVLIPLGKDGLTIKTVNNGKDYLENTTAISIFGRIEKIQKWDDVTVASNLKSKGQAFLNEHSEMTSNISIKAVDLHLVEEGTEKIKLGQLVKCVSVPHGIDEFFPCSKIVTHLDDASKDEFTLGVVLKGMTDRQIELEKGLTE